MPNQTEAAKALAAQLGLLDTGVFFGDWIAYADWPHVLQECDVALTLHHDTVETRLAFRSRVLEYIWAELPIVASGGDATSDLIARYDLGLITPEADVEAVATAMARLLDEPRSQRTAQFSVARAALTWERAAAPLVAYCQAPNAPPTAQRRARQPMLLTMIRSMLCAPNAINGAHWQRPTLGAVSCAHCAGWARPKIVYLADKRSNAVRQRHSRLCQGMPYFN